MNLYFEYVISCVWTLFCFARWKFMPNQFYLCAYSRCLQPLCWRRLVTTGVPNSSAIHSIDSISAWYIGVEKRWNTFNTFQYQRAKRDTFNIIEGNICALASLGERGTAQRVSLRRKQSSSLSASKQSIPSIWQRRSLLPSPNPEGK